MARSRVPHLAGVCGLIGLLGFPPFGVIAWIAAEMDIRAPGFEQMPWSYQRKVRAARVQGMIGTFLMFVWGAVFVVAAVVQLLS